MVERIKKTPIKEALASLNIVWEDAQKRLDDMNPQEVFTRMRGAVYYNSAHPFRDKLHIEGMMAGLEFVLTGHSDAVEYLLKRAESIKAGEAVPVAESPLTEPRVPLTTFVTRIVSRLFSMPRSKQ